MFKTVVRATWKNPAEVIGKDDAGKPILKRYSAKISAVQYDNTEEARNDLGDRGVVDCVNEKQRKIANDKAKARLIAKVTGGAADLDIEEVEIEDDDE